MFHRVDSTHFSFGRGFFTPFKTECARSFVLRLERERAKLERERRERERLEHERETERLKLEKMRLEDERKAVKRSLEEVYKSSARGGQSGG